MENESVFSKVPDYGYKEEAPEIDSGEFQKVIDSRRSVRVFEKIPIPDDIMKKCLHNALLAPNSSNLQPAELYWIRNEEQKKRVVAACLSQPAARYAAELIVVVARTGTWKKHAKEMTNLFTAAKNDVLNSAINYYSKLVPMAYSTGPLNIFGFMKKIAFFFMGLARPMVREPVSKNDVKVWAVKSTALAAENLMLSLRAYGYDSCPMEGLDSKRIKKILGLTRDAVVVMAIGAGKRAEKGIYGPRLRFDASRYIHEV